SSPWRRSTASRPRRSPGSRSRVQGQTLDTAVSARRRGVARPSPLRPSARDLSEGLSAGHGRFGHHRVAEEADAVDLDLDDVAGVHGDRRRARLAAAARRPREDEGARGERAEAGGVGDETPDPEDELGRVPVLEHLAVQALDDAQPAPVPELRDGDEAVADGAERVEALSTRPLLVAVLQVARGHVVRTAVAGDEVERVVLADPPPDAPDLDRELRLRVDVGRLRRQDDRLAGPDHGRVELPEEERLRRRLAAGLADVAQVVQAGAEDFHGDIVAG